MPTLITGPLDTLPAAPDPATDSPSTFSTKAAAMVLAIKTMVTQLITIISQINTVTTEVNTNTATASAAAAAAAVSAAATSAVALAAANFKGTWATRTGAATVPYSVSHIGGFWMLLSNLADVTTKTPGTDPEWQRIDRMPPATLVTDLVYQASPGEVIALSNDTTQASTTNNLLYSDDPSNAAWTKVGGATVTTGFTTDPDGTMLGAKIEQAGTGSSLAQVFAASGTSTQTAIRYFKSISSANILMRIFWFSGGATQSVYVAFNPQTGALISALGAGATLLTYSMLAVGDGWYRVSVSGTGTDAANTTVQVAVYDQSSASHYYTYRGQCTPTAVPTSDIATTSAPVPRTAGVVAPQRVVLPPTPSADNAVRIFIANGIDTNVVAANGTGIEDQSGSDVMQLDRPYGKADLQVVNNKWKVSI